MASPIPKTDLDRLAARLPAAVFVLGIGLSAMVAWTLHALANDELHHHVGQWVEHHVLPWLAFGVGGLISALLTALLHQLSTGRQRAEALAASMTADLQRLALVARETSNAVVITDAQRRITWVNAGFERLTGYGAQEALGRSPGELLQFEGTDPWTIQQMRLALNKGHAFKGDVLNRARNGHVYWLELDIQPVRGPQGELTGFIAIESDISSRKAMQAQVDRNAQLLLGAIETIDEAFVLFDPSDRLLICNEKYLQVYETSRDLLVPGAKFEDIIRLGVARGQYPAAQGREEAWIAERLAQHSHGNTSLIQRLDNGRVLRFLERKMPDGHTVGIRVDITDLARATEAAEQASRTQSEFIATVSHELRTPLQSIMGFSDLGMHFARDMPQFHQMFTDIHHGGKRMLNLVNGLLDVSKINNQEGSLALSPVDLNPLIQEVVQELEHLAQRHDLKLHLVPHPHPLTAQADTFRFQQVIRNVLANAIRFAPPDSTVEIQATRVPVTGQPERCRIEVRDRGPGIPDDELDTIFEPFVQSSRTRDGAGGTGLGLAICRKIMDAHRGHIRAFNTEHGGALIRIELPAGPMSSPSVQETAPLPAD
jgi:PAS domain S-box-containing protein